MRAALCFLVLGLSSTLCLSQTASPTVTRDPQAVNILKQAYAVMTLGTQLDVKDSIVEAVISRGVGLSRQQSAVTLKSKGQFVRIDARESARSVVVGRGRSSYKDDKGWRLVLDPNTVNRQIEHLPAQLLADLLTRNDVELTYVGIVQLDGESFHRVKAGNVHRLGAAADAEMLERVRRNSEVDLFIHATSNLLVKISYPLVSLSDWRRSVPVEVTYEDYRDSAGVLVPFHQSKSMAGQSYAELSIRSVRFNVGLNDSDFSGGLR
jgi:hypothetical protein